MTQATPQPPARAPRAPSGNEQIIVRKKDLPGAEAPPAPEAITVRAPRFPFDPNVIALRVENIAISFFLSMAFIIVGFPIARAFARRMDRSRVGPAGPVELSRDATERLNRIEQAVESVAIEVERISEGQRFTTKLLSERAEAVPAERRLGTS